ncbi:hypothetical protein FHR49_002245 [Xanthomonas campestris]
MSSNAEIARDLLVASIGRAGGSHNGDWIAEQFKIVLKGVAAAVQEDDDRQRDIRRERANR